MREVSENCAGEGLGQIRDLLNIYIINCKCVSSYGLSIARVGQDIPIYKDAYNFTSYLYTNVTRVCRVLKCYIYHKNFN